MPRLNVLNEGSVRALASAESYRRGQEYARSGAVASLVRRADELLAEVEGSQFTPYRVRIAIPGATIGDASCTCPYDWGGLCKHTVAVLLTWIANPDRVPTRPALADQLGELDRTELVELLRWLLGRQPDLESVVDTWFAVHRAPKTDATAGETAAARRRNTAIDPTPFRRRARSAMHSLDRVSSMDAYYGVSGVVGEIESLVREAQPFIEAGDGRSALAILDAVTGEYVDTWFDLDGSDGDTGEVFQVIGPLWTRAMLAADLTPDERRAWAEKLAGWDRECADYGVDDAFAAARDAALTGWDDPELQRVLRGETTPRVAAAPEGETSGPAVPAGPRFRVLYERDLDDEDFDEEDLDEDEDDEGYDDGYYHSGSDWYRDDLTSARIDVLRYQGRFEEALNLARAERRSQQCATLLLDLERIDEAIAYARGAVTDPQAVLSLVQTLMERGASDEAFALASHGLNLPGYKVALAMWLRDAAVAAGDAETAVTAGRAVVREQPTLEDYLKLVSLAGERWPALRDEVLSELRQRHRAAYLADGYGEILLHEGLIDEAIALAEGATWHYAFVAKVADAALPSRPEWVARVSRAQAEEIMNAGRSSHYDDAARWLGRVRAVLVSLGRAGEWQEYIEGLLATHARKYKLVPLLKPLR